MFSSNGNMTSFSIKPIPEPISKQTIVSNNIDYYSTYLIAPEICYKQIYEEIKDCLGHHTIVVWGKEVKEPRLGAFFSLGGVQGYTYSKAKRPTFDLEKYPLLRSLGKAVSTTLGVEFNSCLINLYRDGKDYIGEHSDDERDLVKSNIASISLGATRDFVIKERAKDSKLRLVLALKPGSLVHMYGMCQKLYKHSIPKRLRCKEPRLNITFRVVGV